jgi:hypothetical protein
MAFDVRDLLFRPLMPYKVTLRNALYPESAELRENPREENSR